MSAAWLKQHQDNFADADRLLVEYEANVPAFKFDDTGRAIENPGQYPTAEDRRKEVLKCETWRTRRLSLLRPTVCSDGFCGVHRVAGIDRAL